MNIHGLQRLTLVMTSLALLTAGLQITANGAEGRKIAPVHQWAGQVGTTTAITTSKQPEGPAAATTNEWGGCLLSEEELDKFLRHWEITNAMPKINFQEDLALFYLGHGGPVLMRLAVEDEGNLVTDYVQTPTWSLALNYLITSVSRAGIKSVNGKSVEK